MPDLWLIGIGTGNPDHVTLEARQALRDAALVMVPRKGPDKADLAELRNDFIEQVGHQLNAWTVRPAATEGYRTAEVTLGGVDTDELSSRTMEAKKVPGLYFIGEVVDVTGHLGGFNFQWAWASGYAAGNAV